MRNTKDAIKYGIETLKVSPEKMFNLIESSRDYDGDDYDRWLANEIIKLAEEDGVGYSQLLVKKFSIIQDIMKDCSSESTMSEYWKQEFYKYIDCENLYTCGMPDGVGTDLSSVDWFTGIDYDSENSEFIKGMFDGDFVEKFLSKEGIGLLLNLSSDSVDKSCDLYSELKFYKEVSCKNTGALMLYRMCAIASAFADCLHSFKVAFLCPVSFLYDQENASIFSYFLNFFKYSGFVIPSSMLYPESYIGGKYAFVVCSLRGMDDSIQDGIRLGELVYDEEEDKYYQKRSSRYTRSSVPMINELKEFKNPKGAVVFGYMCYNHYGDIWLSSSESDSCIAITKYNLKKVVAFYGVYVSGNFYGLSGDINCMIDGNDSFNELFYNCFPLFLYDVNSKFTGGGQFDSLSSKLVSNILEKGQLYFGYEAKDLLSICKGFLDYLNITESLSGKTFEEVRKEASYEELNSQYMSALRNLKDYVCTLYRKIQ